jgi:molybdate transport system ATP-binding protein
MEADTFKATPLVSLNQVTLRVRDRRILAGTSWEVRIGQHWAVLGPNGAGKSTLVRALVGDVPVVRGEIFPSEPSRLRQQAACVSFERQRALMAWEDRQQEHLYFSGVLDGGARVEDLLRVSHAEAGRGTADLLRRVRIEALLERRLGDLSSGEMRRFQIAMALAASPRLLILDEPFEGLDQEARTDLANLINEVMDSERSVVLVTHRRSEIPPRITHAIGVKAGQVAFQGRREDVLSPERMESLFARRPLATGEPPTAPGPGAPLQLRSSEALVDLHNVTVRHKSVVVFENLSWRVRPGEHWAICGPNGSGKSSLLSLVVGDHPQAYAHAVRVFGKLRGGGGSIQELKAGIGLISPELQVRYRKAITAIEVALSGFFDSVGLYRRSSPAQEATARFWMDQLGIRGLAAKRFNHLSHGEQRMVLLARAMVKPPRLLVLDEPCQGLDTGNRQLILQAVDRIAATGATTILFVSHHADETPACITHRLNLIRQGAGPSRAVLSAAP